VAALVGSGAAQLCFLQFVLKVPLNPNQPA